MAVEVVQNPQTAQSTGALAPFAEVYHFFADNWILMVSFLIVAILAFAVYLIWKKLDEERKERDDKVYLHYVNVVSSCIDNARDNWIRKYWNPASLFLLLIPVIGWIIIPFVKKEGSNTIRDIDNNFVGFYRGHSYLDDGTIAIMYYRTKSFFFFEDTKVLVIPTNIALKTEDDRGNTKVFYRKIKPVRFEDNYVKINMTSTRKRGMYFWFPVLVDEERSSIHLSSTIIDNLKSSTGYEVIESLTSDFSRQMQKAVNISAEVRKTQESEVPSKNVGEN